MFTRRFWSSGSWKDASLSHGTSHNLDGRSGAAYELSSSSGSKDNAKRIWEKAKGDLESGIGHRGGKSSATLVSRSVESLQYIIQGNNNRSQVGLEKGLEVKVETSFRVERETVEGVRVGDEGEEVGQREEEWERTGSFVRKGRT